MDSMRAAYDEVYVYTMGRPGFILQYVVDAFAVQTANDKSKPITIVFGLVGIYLHVEKQFSGHQVQRVHMELGRRKREWPRMYVPEDRGSMTVADVLAATAGPDRDRAIDNWCRSVWTAFGDNRQTIIALLGNTRSRSHDGLGAGIRDAWMGGQKEVGIVAWNWTPPDSRPLDNPLRSDQNWHRRTKGEYRLGQWPQPF